MSAARLRQVVLVARDLDAVAGQLRAALDLAAPFHDPGVAQFGLRNAVMALGDPFVEVVSPTQPGTAAGRRLERLGGDGGYMAMVQVGDLAAARARVAALGVRVVWSADLPGIAGTHLHPKDTGGTLLSLDAADPSASWAWAGPGWTGGAPAHDDRAVTGATIAAREPAAVAERWRALLERPPRAGDPDTVALDGGGTVRFVPGDAGLVAVAVAGLDAPVEVAGVRFAPAAG